MNNWDKLYSIQDDKEFAAAIDKLAKAKLMTDQDWWSVSLYSRRFSEEFISKWKTCWNWRFINTGDRFWTEDFLIENFDYVDWSTILKNSKVLTPRFIRKLKRKFKDSEWGDLIRLGLFDEDLLREYRNHIPWRVACGCMKLSTSFMREMVDYIDWYELSTQQMIPVNFIREFKDKIPVVLLHNYGKTKLPQKVVFELLGREWAEQGVMP